jgi:diaminopimelate epimerase
MRFTKMHGIGNDYVFVDCFRESVPSPADLAVKISDRHFGVGGDGLILILPSEKAPLRMRIFNADGSEAEMCGNGLRCVAKYAFDRKIVTQTRFPIETGAGVLAVEVRPGAGGVAETVRINMGAPRLLRREIPMQGPPEERAIREKIQVQDRAFEFTAVSMGNPHCVIFLEEDLRAFDVARYGPEIERHRLFPRRTNVEFVTRASETELHQRTWERGSGETLACGTGASAVCVAANLLGLAQRRTLIHLAGGDLQLEWAEDGCVYKTGPATEVFQGEWNL